MLFLKKTTVHHFKQKNATKYEGCILNQSNKLKQIKTK